MHLQLIIVYLESIYILTTLTYCILKKKSYIYWLQIAFNKNFEVNETV